MKSRYGYHQLLYRATRDAQCPDLRYEPRRTVTEQLLALPEAIAWCWVKGGDWRRRIEPIVTTVREVRAIFSGLGPTEFTARDGYS